MTALWFIAAVAIPCWGTYALVKAGSRELPQTTATTILRVCLASGIGWGWGSGTYYLWLLAFGRPQGMYLAVDALSWFLLSFLFRAERPPHALLNEPSPIVEHPGLARRADVIYRKKPAPSRAAFRRTLRMAYAIVLTVALAGLFGQILAEPNGGWDAWAIWNLRARFLYRLGDNWPQALAGAFHHTDYPLLIPGSLARCWTFLGDDPRWTGAGLGIAFTLATVAVVTAAVTLRRGADLGMLAGMVLLGTARFLRWGALQYADVPLSFFFLSTLVLLMQHEELRREHRGDYGAGLLLLAGMTTGLAAWTKNEGLLFAAAVLLIVPALAGRRQGWKTGLRQGGLVLMGAAPALAMVFLFKSQVPFSNDLVAGQGVAATIGRVFDPARHYKIVAAMLTNGIQVAHLYTAIIPACFLLLGRNRGASSRAESWALPAGVIGLVCAGYYGIYLTTPHDLDWHLATSLDRLIVQLWPMVVFAIILQLRTPEEVLAQANPSDEGIEGTLPAAIRKGRRAA